MTDTDGKKAEEQIQRDRGRENRQKRMKQRVRLLETGSLRQRDCVR